MKQNKQFFLLIVLFLSATFSSFAQWKPTGDHIRTAWADSVDVNAVLPGYPRPIMQRDRWANLNGLWSYAIRPVKESALKGDFEGQLLVPFAIESSLSGVGRKVGAENNLWLQRTFSVPSAWKGETILLHFGAVDWETTVWVNGMQVGSHRGGFTEFTFDITDALKKGDNELLVRVWDPCDRGTQPRGKQVSNPGGIWYTSVTGVWQTVWMEPVNDRHIERLKITPDVDRNRLMVAASITNVRTDAAVTVKVFDAGRLVGQATSLSGEATEVPMPADVKLWSPDAPFLYDLQVELSYSGKVVDRVESYAAMRKFSRKVDEKGVWRICLNNEPVFSFAPLDQGWWPDGLYTAPTDAALLYDIQKTKDFGFNSIRKHIKVEPARWYTWCDRMGIIVWQDMPSGDAFPQWQNHAWYKGDELVRSAESEAEYRKEWREIIDQLYSYPCIAIWVPFNEAWGQFKTKEITEWTATYDATRLVNSASGGNFFPCGDIIDLHNYPQPDMYLTDSTRVLVLGEYGGIGLPQKGHLWEADRNWGYVQYNSAAEVTDKYVEYARSLRDYVAKGFSGAVYTQTTDVEVEVNGLMTYDRKVIKVDEKRVREANLEVINAVRK